MVAALIADGFRNYLRAGHRKPAEELLVERANMLTLTASEMTVLVGGMRALNANSGQSKHGVLTKRPGTLTNDFFVNLLDLNTEWKTSASDENVYEGRDRATGELNRTVLKLVQAYAFISSQGRGKCGRSLPTRCPFSMTDRQAPTLCRATSVVPSKVNVARGHFFACSSSLAKI